MLRAHSPVGYFYSPLNMRSREWHSIRINLKPFLKPYMMRILWTYEVKMFSAVARRRLYLWRCDDFLDENNHTPRMCRIWHLVTKLIISPTFFSSLSADWFPYKLYMDHLPYKTHTDPIYAVLNLWYFSTNWLTRKCVKTFMLLYKPC